MLSDVRSVSSERRGCVSVWTTRKNLLEQKHVHSGPYLQQWCCIPKLGVLYHKRILVPTQCCVDYMNLGIVLFCQQVPRQHQSQQCVVRPLKTL